MTKKFCGEQGERERERVSLRRMCLGLVFLAIKCGLVHGHGHCSAAARAGRAGAGSGSNSSNSSCRVCIKTCPQKSAPTELLRNPLLLYSASQNGKERMCACLRAFVRERERERERMRVRLRGRE